MTELEQFLSERNNALTFLDQEYVARMVPNAPASMRLLILHKARYECTAIKAELRRESGRWLVANGFGRMSGEPVLPDGELPE